MTGLAQSARVTVDSRADEANTPMEVSPQTAPVGSSRPRGLAARGGWRGIGWFACGVAGSLAIAWFISLSRGEMGSKADWFFGAVVLCVVIVTMWQTFTIQRQANQNAAEAPNDTEWS